MAKSRRHHARAGLFRPTATASSNPGAPLGADELRQTHAFWRTCDDLALGMIYLQNNPLPREALPPEHIKNRLLGHWGASGRADKRSASAEMGSSERRMRCAYPPYV